MSRESFLTVYANLPINLRKEAVLVLKKYGPITWEVAYLEVKGKTKLSEEILRHLEELRII